MEAGFHVIAAPDTGTALSLLEGHPEINLCLVDLVMPASDGVAFARSAKGHRPDMPIVLMTGYYSTAEKVAGLGLLSSSRSTLKTWLPRLKISFRSDGNLDSATYARLAWSWMHGDYGKAVATTTAAQRLILAYSASLKFSWTRQRVFRFSCRSSLR